MRLLLAEKDEGRRAKGIKSFMKKKLLALFLGAAMAAASLTGCGSGDTDWSQYVTLGEYKGIEVAAPAEVTDEEVDQQIQYVLQSYAEKKEITDRPVQEGDIVNIDYVGKKDGVEFDGGTAEGADLTIGSNTYIDGFEDGLIGKNIGETVDLNLTFPEVYQNNPDLAGADVVFTVTINSITESTLPELTDEFVTENLGADSADAYKAQIKESLTNYREQQIPSTIWNTVVENAEVKKYPEDEVQEQVDSIVDYAKEAAESNSQTYEEYLQSNYSVDEETFLEKANEQAENTIKELLVVRAIAQEEDITVSDEEYEEWVTSNMANYNMSTVEAMEEQFGKDEIKERVLWEKVLEFLQDNANIQ